MNIVFLTKELEKLCTEKRIAKKKLGGDGFKKLKARLADIRAARMVSELVAGRPHPLKGDREGQFSLSFNGGVRLVFKPADEPAPQKEDGATNWNRVSTIRIIYLGDYHD
jgi:toxin HigB-1